MRQYDRMLGIISLGLLFLTMFNAPPILAQQSDSKDFFDLDLSELSNVIVSVASTREESIPVTPAIVSRYNADEMSMLGLRTLKDMLSFIPGVVVQDSLLGTTPIMIRGLSETFNQKILFLIDDVPYFQPDRSDIPLHGVPIEAIDHIEVIRGPGAVYYGTNAAAGVIKVVTRQPTGNRLSFTTGCNQLINFGGILGRQSENDVKFSISFEFQDEDGYDATFYGLPETTSITKKEKEKSVLAKLSVADINLLAQAFKSQVNGLNDHTPGINHGEAEYKGYMVHLDHQRELIGADVKIFSDYNIFYPQVSGENFYSTDQGLSFKDGGTRFSNHGNDNFRLRSGITIEYELFRDLLFFSGAEYERRSVGSMHFYNAATDQDEITVLNEDKMTEESLFAQMDYTFGSWRFLLGGRFTSNTKSGDELTPRFSSIYKINEHQSIKFLAAKGFNSPNFIQQGLTNKSGIVASDPNLTAETVETVDLAYTFAAKKSIFVANIYFIEAERMIKREEIIMGPGKKRIYYSNNENFQRYGAELDFQYETKLWKLFSNLAYQNQGDKVLSGDDSAKFTPRFTACLGGFYKPFERHSLGGSLRFIGERAQAKTINLLNINYQYTRNNWELFATARNLFDREPLNPDVSNYKENLLIPGGDRINFLLGAKYSF